MPSDPQNVQALFLAAAEKSLPERATFLQCQCGADATLRQRVEALLRAHDEPGSILGLEQTIPIPPPDQADRARLGTQIGPYILRELLGEGGMGVVYVAEQLEPIRRKVALKIIKPGMDIQRYIADEPVEAGPPSTLYRLRKLARRHRRTFWTVATVACALFIGTSVAVWQAIEANRARYVSEERADREQLAHDQAEVDRNRAEASLRLFQHSAYVSDIQLASYAWQRNDVASTRAIQFSMDGQQLLVVHPHDGIES